MAKKPGTKSPQQAAKPSKPASGGSDASPYSSASKRGGKK